MKENTKLSAQEMVAEVNRFIFELGLNDEILGLKNNKVLYYYNYIYPQNVFKGILELHSYYFIKLANLLCNTTERLKVFYEKFYDADGNIAQQFRKYRRYILDSRGSTDEYLGVMDKMIKYECHSALHMTLQELFLEPIEQHIFDRILGLIHIGLDASDIYGFYLQKRNLKSLVCYNISYIKQLSKQ